MRTHRLCWLTIRLGGALLIGLLGPALRAEGASAGASARYHVLGSGEKSERVVVGLRLTVLGEAVHEGARYVDWQMDAELKDGRKLAVRAASERAPMTSAKGCGEFLRYQLRLPGGEVFEYRHERTGLAVLPAVAFRELLLPTPDDEPVLIDGFAGAGRYLGHVLILDRVSRDFTVDPIKDAVVLHLRPDMLIGTSRSFKDDGKGRPSTTANYNYVEFVEKDYDEMIAAGANYFGVSDGQAKRVRGRPVFYRGPAAFPEDYYRSNYLPGPMFTDEPMSRLDSKGEAPTELDHPQQMASYLMSRVRHIYADPRESGLFGLVQGLGAAGIHIDLSPSDCVLAPVWETEYQTAFYQLAGGAPGIVHEGRYVKEGYGWHPKSLFGPGLEVTTREMLLCYYAFMRGAARAFDGHWGTAIYGQSDPAMRVEALALAYDMGAKDLWFWTSDHDHHVPYTEQLALTRTLMKHAGEHPRGDMDELRRSAKVGIVFPNGYTLSWGHLWGQRSFSFENRNRTDTAYREVAAAAVWEGVLCAKRGIPFDFTVEHEGIDKLGYEQLLFVGEDAGVRPVPDLVRSDPVRPRVQIEPGEPERIDGASEVPQKVIRAMPAYGCKMTVNASLDEWDDADWVSHRDKPSGGGKWDGPEDLSTRIAFAYDERHFYVAAVVKDDRHHQPLYGWELWKGDCIQIGLDPLNEENRRGYSGNQQEIGLMRLDDGRAIAWRWHCRRGQRPREMADVKVAIERRETTGETVYEAAVPLSELAPMSPPITPLVGIAVTFNDADLELRETFHETSPGAMVAGKQPADFRKLYMPPPSNEARGQVTGPRGFATLVWHETVAPVGGQFAFDCRMRSWDQPTLTLAAQLEPLQPLMGLPGSASVRVPVGDRVELRRVRVSADTEPGRYRLTVTVKDEHEALLAQDAMTVFVYPPRSGT